MDFPVNCIRGIRKSSWVNDEGKVSGLAFEPDLRTKDNREDQGCETSINWEDDSNALSFTLKEYEHGVVRLQTQKIDYVNRIHGALDSLKLERDLLPKNPYHGNLVFSGRLRKIEIKQIASTLALGASDIITPD